jgi:hypothetical protein
MVVSTMLLIPASATTDNVMATLLGNMIEMVVHGAVKWCLQVCNRQQAPTMMNSKQQLYRLRLAGP